MPKLMIAWNREELNSLQYPIIVESYHRVKDFGSKRRVYENTFTDTERQQISKLYHKFHDWYLVSGTPEKAVFNTKTVELIKRAVNFFATL